MLDDYRLPSGKWTKDPDECEREWRALAKPIETATGCVMGGFDPGVSFVSPEGDWVSLPTWFIKLINPHLMSTSGDGATSTSRENNDNRHSLG